MKEFFIAVLLLAVVVSSETGSKTELDEKTRHSQLLGRNDGHEPFHRIDNGGLRGHDFVGVHDGDVKEQAIDHDGLKSGGLLGRKDGHEPNQIIDHGGLEEKHLVGHDDGDVTKDLLGRKDGHEPFHYKGADDEKMNSLPNQDVQKEKDVPVIGKPDGHEDNVFNKYETPYEGGQYPEEEYEDSRNSEFENFFHISQEDALDDDKDDDYFDDEYSDEEGDGGEELVRCKRPLCNESLSCSIGPKTDSKGCSICECLKDPCEGESCEVGYACDLVECIPGKRCDKLGFQCIRKHCNGPQPMCANRCDYGYALNNEGCDTCICRLPPADENKIDNVGEKAGEEDNYESQNYSDDDDDDDDDDEEEEDAGDDDDDNDDVDGWFKMDGDYWGEDGEDKKEKIDDDDEEDDDDDENGHDDFTLVMQDRNAQSCGFSCTKSQFCDTVQKDCKKRTRCWLEQEHSSLLLLHSPFSTPHPGLQSCDTSFWTYKPLQCGGHKGPLCWCVDVLGRMINKTLTKVVKKELEPICKEKLVESITFALDFTIKKDGSGEGRLNDLLLDKLSSISTARKIDIHLVMNPVKHTRLTYHVTLKYSNMYDIGYAAEAIRLYNGMAFKSEDFEVVQLRPAVLSEVVEYEEVKKDKTIDVPWKDVFEEELPVRHLVHTNRSIRIILFITFVAMATAIFVLLILMMYRLYQRRGTIRHHALPTHLPSTLNPAQLLSSSKKGDKVLLVENDVMDKNRVA